MVHYTASGVLIQVFDKFDKTDVAAAVLRVNQWGISCWPPCVYFPGMAVLDGWPDVLVLPALPRQMVLMLLGV